MFDKLKKFLLASMVGLIALSMGMVMFPGMAKADSGSGKHGGSDFRREFRIERDFDFDDDDDFKQEFRIRRDFDDNDFRIRREFKIERDFDDDDFERLFLFDRRFDLHPLIFTSGKFDKFHRFDNFKRFDHRFDRFHDFNRFDRFDKFDRFHH